MTLGLVGRKVGMTRIFTDDGDSLPVTVLDVSDNRVTQIKTSATDGYSAVQVTFGRRRASRVNQPLARHPSTAGGASMSPAPPRARGLRVSSSATTSGAIAPATETPFPTEAPVPLARTRIRAACFPASAWRAPWALWG